ncbi:MAG: hypothetical protein WCL00_10260 [Bacteroidota bacterium]
MNRLSVLVFFLLIFLYCKNSDAQQPQIKWHFDTQAPAFGQAAMGDIDGDGKPEIVFSCYMNDGKCYALNAEDGSKLW